MWKLDYEYRVSKIKGLSHCNVFYKYTVYSFETSFNIVLYLRVHKRSKFNCFIFSISIFTI